MMILALKRSQVLSHSAYLNLTSSGKNIHLFVKARVYIVMFVFIGLSLNLKYLK